MITFPQLSLIELGPPPAPLQPRVPREALVSHLVALLHWADQQELLLDDCLDEAEALLLEQVDHG